MKHGYVLGDLEGLVSWESIGVTHGIVVNNSQSTFLPPKALATAPPHIDPRIAAAAEKIQTQIETHHTVDALAAEQHITPTQFRKLFKRDMGITPKAYITQVTMKHACQLLKRSQTGIQEIAHICGFHHAHHFHLRFKQHTGQTPAEFRRAVIL